MTKKKMETEIVTTKKEMPHKKTISGDPIKLQELQNMAKIGMTMEQIANVHGMRVQTLYNRIKENSQLMDAIKRGKGKGVNKIAGQAYKMASKGDNTAMTIFWLKTQAGWKEPQHFEFRILQEIYGKKSIDDLNYVECKEIIELTDGGKDE